jgi:succinyl-CoA synthetase beta subunit
VKKHPDLRLLGDGDLIHPLERKAAEGGLFYHKSRAAGTIGWYGYGAGVAMSTMDALVAAGGKVGSCLGLALLLHRLKLGFLQSSVRTRGE